MSPDPPVPDHWPVFDASGRPIRVCDPPHPVQYTFYDAADGTPVTPDDRFSSTTYRPDDALPPPAGEGGPDEPTVVGG